MSEIRFVRISPERHQVLRRDLRNAYGSTGDDPALIRQRMNQFEYAFVTQWITDEQEERWQPVLDWLTDQFGPTSSFTPIYWSRIQWYVFIRNPEDATAFKMRWC
ncbi:MAG: hypothetical protein EOP84_07175 [Verrucomicrobiaceae bacterium]|nr:MAG: hypothetical protein EOP84_07175 [Verrucomicrobiaceae bacterium]